MARFITVLARHPNAKEFEEYIISTDDICAVTAANDSSYSLIGFKNPRRENLVVKHTVSRMHTILVSDRY